MRRFGIRTTGVGVGVTLKQLRRIAPHPWIGSKLIKLETERQLRGLVSNRNHGGRAGKIRQVSVRITDLCNLRCHTCGQWGENGYLRGEDLKALRGLEVEVDRYLEILSDLVARGHRPLVYIWGGEPLLYEGLMDLIEGSTSFGLPTSIATNGTGLVAESERMVRAPLFLVQISIDGPDADVHNRIRPSAGNGDNFKEILTGLEAIHYQRKALGKNLPMIASLTVVSRDNFRRLVDIYEAFRQSVDLFVFYLSWWIDPDGAASHERDFLYRFGFAPMRHRSWIGHWKPDDYQVLDRQLRTLLSRSRPLSAPPVILIPHITGMDALESYYTDHEDRFGFERCHAIHQMVEINSNGDVSPCRDYSDYVVGNIKSEAITDLWNSPAFLKFRRSLSEDGLMPACSRCCGLMGY